MKYSYTVLAQQEAPQPTIVQQSEMALDSIALFGIGLSIGGFIIKWLFDQAIKRWEDKFADLQDELAKIEKSLQSQQAEFVSVKHLQIAEQRIENLGRSLAESQRFITDNQKAMIELRSEMNNDFTRKEDWVRFSQTLEAKMDGLNRKMDERFETLFLRRSGEYGN